MTSGKPVLAALQVSTWKCKIGSKVGPQLLSGYAYLLLKQDSVVS